MRGFEIILRDWKPRGVELGTVGLSIPKTAPMTWQSTYGFFLDMVMHGLGVAELAW